MRVTYNATVCGLPSEGVSEWVCPEHDGYARSKFVAWWRRRSLLPLPRTTTEAVRLAQAGALAAPTRIRARTTPGERFARIINYDLPPPPAYEDAPAEEAEAPDLDNFEHVDF